jgi:hypothetical protein
VFDEDATVEELEEDKTPGVTTTTVEQLLQVGQLCDKFSKIKFNTVKLPVLVQQHKEATCLLDSGANINCVSFELIKEIRKKHTARHKMEITKNSAVIQVGNGNLHHIPFSVNIRISFCNGHSGLETFQVIRGLSVDMILGTPALHNLKLEFLFSTSEMLTPKGNIPFTLYKEIP